MHHHGERANSGHYTATTRNAIDNCWRNFDDVKVTSMSQTSDIRLSNNAYLLFYERKFSTTDSNGSAASKSLTTSATRWFPSSVPRTVQIYFEEQRRQIKDNFESRAERLRRELDDFSLNDDRILIKPIHSGLSTFYTGTALKNSNLSNGDYSPNRHNSVTSKAYSDSNEVFSPKKPVYYYHDCTNNNNVKSPVKSYYYGSVDSPPASCSSANHLSHSRQSLYQNHQKSALMRELSTEPCIKPSTSVRYINGVNNNNNGYTSGLNSTSKYSLEYSTLPSSTKRSKSYQALSNSALHPTSGNGTSPYSAYSRDLVNNSNRNCEYGVSSRSSGYADNLNKNFAISAYRR